MGRYIPNTDLDVPGRGWAWHIVHLPLPPLPGCTSRACSKPCPFLHKCKGTSVLFALRYSDWALALLSWGKEATSKGGVACLGMARRAWGCGARTCGAWGMHRGVLSPRSDTEVAAEMLLSFFLSVFKEQCLFPSPHFPPQIHLYERNMIFRSFFPELGDTSGTGIFPRAHPGVKSRIEHGAGGHTCPGQCMVTQWE